MTGRVLFVTSNYPRWAGDSTTPFVHHLAVLLREFGWHATVLAPHAPGAATRDSLDGVPVRRFRYLLPERAETVCYGGGALVNLRSSKTNLAKVPALVAAEWFAALHEMRHHFDVVHAHWALPQGFVATTLPRMGAARVVTVHGGDVYGLRGRGIDRFMRLTFGRADAVTVNSAATERAVRELAGPSARIDRIPMGIDLDRSPDPDRVVALRAEHRRDDGPLLVFVGRLVAEKGVADVVDAVAALAPELPGVRAAIVGTGQHLEELLAYARVRGVADRIAFPGWADPEDVPNWFAAADVVLAPSRIGPDGWQEGQGLTIIEAMALGRPVVSTRTGGIVETITDGRTGLLVEPSRPDQLAAAVTRLQADAELATALGRRGRESVLNRFSQRGSASRFVELYEQLHSGRVATWRAGP